MTVRAARPDERVKQCRTLKYSLISPSKRSTSRLPRRIPANPFAISRQYMGAAVGGSVRRIIIVFYNPICFLMGGPMRRVSGTGSLFQSSAAIRLPLPSSPPGTTALPVMI